MLQRILLPVILLFPLLFGGCEEEFRLEDVISDTWVLEWKRCGFYHNYYDVKMNFDYSDTTNSGWYLEAGDTSFFKFSVIDNQTISIDSGSTQWIGELKVSAFSSSFLEFERAEKACENELFRFR